MRLLPTALALVMGVAVAIMPVLTRPAVAAPAAPPIALPLLDAGQRFDSRALLNKRILVVRFQASWCRICAAEATSIQHLYETYRDRGVEVLAIHVEDTTVDARRFLEEHGATYPAGLDPKLRIANRFGFKGTPYTVVIDRKGEMVARIHGPANEARLARVLDPMVAPKPARKPPPRRLQ